MKSPFILKIKYLLESINSKLIIGLILLSVLLMSIHRMGALDIEKDLLSEYNYFTDYALGSDNMLAKHSNDNGLHIVTCKPLRDLSYSYCGLGVTLNEGWPAEGTNLDRYHTIVLKIILDAGIEEPRVRVSFRNYNEVYSNESDSISLKFNSISYAPHKYSREIRVPLNSFQVESWWVEQQKIEFENAQLEFSNVALLEFVTDTVSLESDTVLRVEKATLYGEVISERVLIWYLAAFSLVTVCVLIALQHYKLHKASTTDTLTGLYNRRGLHEWVGYKVSHDLSHSNLTMFFFDIDDFKKVNDSYGHMVGDELLRAFCDLIKRFISDSELRRLPHAFARLSGDEFALVYKDLEKAHIQSLAHKIMHSSRSPVGLSNASLGLHFSLGIASSDEKTKSFDILLSKADSAMYHAKKRGKGQFKIFDDSVAQDVLFRKMVAENLALSLQKEQFHLVFMPIYHTQSQQIVCCEILLRCDSTSLLGIGPDKFIPVAEQYNLIEKIDSWVLENAFKKIVAFNRVKNTPEICFSINISASQLHNRKFVSEVKSLIKKYKIDTSCIEFEITETSLIETDQEAIETLRQLSDMGICLSLDDFGTGYTAFNQLLNYPVNCLKIDKAFTDQIPDDRCSDVVMVNAILSIANSYKLKTTAEGIEHEYQLEYMKNHCCDRVQGYYFSKPLPFEEFVDFCIENTKDSNEQYLRWLSRNNLSG